jgi:hypothetical protein
VGTFSTLQRARGNHLGHNLRAGRLLPRR